MTELEQLQQDLELARDARDHLGRDMSLLQTCIEGSTAEQMRDNINELRAIRSKYEQLQGCGAPAPAIRDLREAIATTVSHASILTAMLDELAQLRAKERLRADAGPPADTGDLPPDGATGLYLDLPFDADDLAWIQMSWDAYMGGVRPSQLMLVFAAIRRDDRATAEFLRVMNTIVLPLLRRIRLKSQPELAKLGAAGE